MTFLNAARVGTLASVRAAMSGNQSVTTGYISGGRTSPTVGTATIDSFPFAVSSVTLSTIGNLSGSIGRRFTTGNSSDYDGYNSGGIDATIAYATVNRFPFASQVSVYAGALTAARQLAAGINSQTTAYLAGGSLSFPGVATNTIIEFPFASTLTSVAAGNLSATANTNAPGTGHQSPTTGYYTNGIIDSFPFSSPFTTASSIGNLADAVYSAVGYSA